MSRRSRWILLALVVVLVGGAAALVLTQRPKLDDAETAVDVHWKPLRAPDALVLRYQKLQGALSAFDAAGGSDREVSKTLHAALVGWNAALKAGSAGTQAERANTVEAQATRLRANVLGSPRLSEDKAVVDSLTAFAAARPPQAMVSAYNTAVDKYESERTGTLQRPVARVLGYGARPAFELGF
jgi:hypothetical protein